MKILVLSCSTGGGHNACAKYIKEEFEERNIKCDVKNYLEIISKNTSDTIEKIYLDSTKGNGKMFKLIYKLGEAYNKSNLKSPVYMLNKLVKDELYDYIKNNEYDLIICTHLFPSMALTEIKKEHNIKFINVATDYECIPFWNETNPDRFVIPSNLLLNSFVKKGFDKKILLPIGIPISSRFLRAKRLEELPKNKKIVMIVSGSMGFGHMKDLVLRLLDEINDTYFLIICGNNKKLEEDLKNINNNNLIVKGFVNNMNDYIKSSDIVITKPGGLTTTEVAALNKPLIHMMPIPGVETYNAIFFENNKMSLNAESIDKVIYKLKLLLNDKDLQKEIISNQKNIINAKSASDLVDYIIK